MERCPRPTASSGPPHGIGWISAHALSATPVAGSLSPFSGSSSYISYRPSFCVNSAPEATCWSPSSVEADRRHGHSHLNRSILKGKRDYVILAFLVSCALRRNELAGLDVAAIQQREGRWSWPTSWVRTSLARRIHVSALNRYVKDGNSKSAHYDGSVWFRSSSS
jgi:hypothetical protein